MFDSDTKQEVHVNSENVSGAMDTEKDSDVSQSPLHFEGDVLDNKENHSEHDVRLSPFQFFGRSEDREKALNQNDTRSCMTRSESSRRLRKRRLTWLKTEKNDNCCTEIAEGASQHDVVLDRPRFRPIAEEVELEEVCQLLDPMAGRSHGDVNSPSLEISASFWFDTDDSNDGTWWRETKQSSSESSLEDFMPELREGDRPIDPTFIRSPVPKKRGKLALSSEEYEERPEMMGPLGNLYFRRIPRSPLGPPPDETDRKSVV